MIEPFERSSREETIAAIAKKYASLHSWMSEDDAAITYLLLDIHSSLLAAAEKAFSKIGQDRTRVRYGVLRSLLFADDGRLTHNNLVGLIQAPASTITFAVDALEREGVVIRKPHTNRRAAWIHLTPTGKKVASEAVLAIARSMHEITDSALTPAAKKRLRRALSDFYAACEQWSPDEQETDLDSDALRLLRNSEA
jgi:DNA-binding MarR family transcriptional regulator